MSKRKPSKSKPLTNGTQTGRDRCGRFAAGCAGGPGNPLASEVGKRRARLLKAIRNSDIDAAVEVMRDVMRSGKNSDRLVAARLLLSRALGPPIQVDLIERLEAVETFLQEQKDAKS